MFSAFELVSQDVQTVIQFCTAPIAVISYLMGSDYV